MATIVAHKDCDGHFLLIGSGFGAYRTRMPGVFFGSLSPSEEAGEFPMALICDVHGQVGWIFTKDMTVVSVDGLHPRDLLDTEDALPD